MVDEPTDKQVLSAFYGCLIVVFVAGVALALGVVWALNHVRIV